MIDGSIVRAHQHAAGALGGQDLQAIGRSRGGFSTKIHAKVDAFGLPLKFILTAPTPSFCEDVSSVVLLFSIYAAFSIERPLGISFGEGGKISFC